MNVQVTAVRIHEPAQVREIVREALAIADELERGGVTAEAIFNQACVLLGARATVAAPPAPVAVPDPMARLLRGGNAR